MSDQPEALLALADRIDEAQCKPITIATQAATELRRQHSEIERLKAERDLLKTDHDEIVQVILSLMDTLASVETERDALVKALQGVIRVADRDTDEFNAARAALDAAREVKP